MVFRRRREGASTYISDVPVNTITLDINIDDSGVRHVGRPAEIRLELEHPPYVTQPPLPPVYRLLRRDEEPRPGDQYAPVIQFEPGVDETFYAYAAMVGSDTRWEDIRRSNLSVIGVARTHLLRRLETNYRALSLGEPVRTTDYVLPLTDTPVLAAGVTLRFVQTLDACYLCAGHNTHFRFEPSSSDRPEPRKREIEAHASLPGEDE